MPAIEAAKRLGYRVITTDNVATNPGHSLADVSYKIDVTNIDQILQIARKENISGVIAPCTDISVTTAAFVAQALGLPGPPCDAAIILTDKFAFRKYLESTARLSPKVYEVSHNLSIENLFNSTSRWLLKPNRSSGSKGVFIVNNEGEFYSCVAETRAFSLDGCALIEEFINGSQHTCEGILTKGKVEMYLVTDRDTAKPPYVATIGHRVPGRLSIEIQSRVVLFIESLLADLGIYECVFDCDFIVTENQIVLIELTPRLGGNSLTKLFKLALDFDLLDYAISTACGDEYEIPVVGQPKASAIKILGVDRDGRLKWDEKSVKYLLAQDWVIDLIIDVPIDEKISAFKNGRNRIGEILITGNSPDQIDERMIEISERLSLNAYYLSN